MIKSVIKKLTNISCCSNNNIMMFLQKCFSIIFSFCSSLFRQLFKYTSGAELVKVDNFNNYRLKNVALLLFAGNNRMLTVTEKNGKVGLPAGRLMYGEKVFNGLSREYCEETGNVMPELTNIERFVYHGHTAIYVAHTPDQIKTTLGSNADGEINNMHLTKISDAKRSIEGKASFEFRNCAKKSTKLVLAHYGY